MRGFLLCRAFFGSGSDFLIQSLRNCDPIVTEMRRDFNIGGVE